MPFCPNPDCPHRKRLGESAEYLKGVTSCSDCGSTLSETAPFLQSMQTPEKVITTDFWKRLLLTLLLLLLWDVLGHMPIPGINLEEISKLSHDSTRVFSNLSIFALGLLPYLYAYVLVEVCALFLPPLKSWRENGYSGRTKLVQMARWITLVVVLVQGYYFAHSLESITSVQAVYQPGLSFRIILMSTLAAGVFLTLWIADMITTHGVGHGISLLIFAHYVHNLPRRISGIISSYEGTNPVKDFLGIIVVVLVLIMIIVLVERAHQRINVKFADGSEAYLPVKLTTAGITPLDWPASIVLYPVTLAVYFIDQKTSLGHLGIDWSVGGFAYYIVFIVLPYYIFSAFFYRPKNIINLINDVNAQISDSAADDFNKTSSRRNVMALVGSIYLCFFAFLPEISYRIFDFPLNGLAFIVTVAIALDLIGEIRIRRYSGKLVKVAEFQKPMEAGLLRSLLKQKKIPCQLRGYYHRALLYFFGPYIEISVFVPEDKSKEAYEVVLQYLKLA